MLFARIDQERTEQDHITMCTWKSATQTCKSTHASRLNFYFLSAHSLLPSVLLHLCVLSHLIFFPAKCFVSFSYMTQSLNIGLLSSAPFSPFLHLVYLAVSTRLLPVLEFSSQYSLVPLRCSSCLFPACPSYLLAHFLHPSSSLNMVTKPSQKFLVHRVKIWLKV